MSKKNKRFKITYQPNNGSDYNFKVEVDIPLTQKELSTFAMIPGVVALIVNKYVIEVEVSSFFKVFDMYQSFIVFMEQLSYTNTGWSLLSFSDYIEMVNGDPMLGIISDVHEEATKLPHFKMPVYFGTREKGIQELTNELNEALENEDYAACALLRDKILALKIGEL